LEKEVSAPFGVVERFQPRSEMRGNPMNKKHVYGPVPSRRLGLSLGVDLIPHKACPYDCVYCQVGATTDTSLSRRDFFSPDAILQDVESALVSGPMPKVLTLAGSGDASLCLSLGRIIDELHRLCDLPVVLLTNGALLFRDDVLSDALRADVLIPSLDASDPETFRTVNQPHPSLDFDRMVDGLRRASQQHKGIFRLEVMLVPGLNDSDAQIGKIASLAKGMDLSSLDLNTPVRPAPGRKIGACRPSRMESARGILGPCARVVASYEGVKASQKNIENHQEQSGQVVMETISRRPCTLEHIHQSSGLAHEFLEDLLAHWVESGKIQTQSTKEGVFFFPMDAGDNA
jgi:wyosine [tRNA(Phe)-imidazoG37] synthetase (radical SAM superfamily)